MIKRGGRGPFHMSRVSSATHWSPLELFSTAGANSLWVRGDVGLSASAWTDQSGKGNNLAQSTAGNRPTVRAGLGGKNCATVPGLDTIARWYDLPALTIDRRAHSAWIICRVRSTGIAGTDRPLWEFGSGLTDCLVGSNGATSAAKVRVFGTGAQVASYLRSDLMLVLVVADSGGATVRINGVNSALTALTAGTVTGGRLMARTDGQVFGGECYEFGLIDRALSADEITDLENYVQSYYRALPTYGSVVYDGDSLCEGQAATASLGYPQLIDDNIGATYRGISQGLGGRYLSEIQAAAATTASLYDGGFTKNIAVLEGGINDIKTSATAATCLGYTQTWLTAMKGAGFKTIVFGIPKASPTGWTGAMETERQAYNTGLSGLTSLDTIVLPDSISALSDPTNLTYYQSDQLHWNDPTFTQVAGALQTAILAQ